MRRPHWPAPEPDAPLTVRITLRLLLPLALGAAIGLGSVALFGVWCLVVIVPAVLIWNWREQRWLARTKREMAADLARLEELRRGS